MWYEILEAFAVLVATLFAIFTLILKIIKEFKHSSCRPTRIHSEYIDRFSDGINNFSVGSMKILDIKFYYYGRLKNYNSLVDLYLHELEKVNNFSSKLIWSTYISNQEIIGRVLPPNRPIELVRINPAINEKLFGISNLLKDLKAIRENIDIEITYKGIYRGKKVLKLDCD